jgi:hypothetical protein
MYQWLHGIKHDGLLLLNAIERGFRVQISGQAMMRSPRSPVLESFERNFSPERHRRRMVRADTPLRLGQIE